ncbi:uncharacterized protein RHO17_005285 [Thomomys bottae]
MDFCQKEYSGRLHIAILCCSPPLKDSNLTTVVAHSNEDISTAEDSGLRAVIVHSNEDISSCTTAHDPCPAPDDGNVTESKTEVETKRVPTSGLPFKIDILSDTTTKRDELNNNEGNHMKKIANKILLSLSFRILAILLIFVDLGLMVTDITVTTSKLHIPLEYRSLSLVIAIFFLLDVVLQVFLKGKKHYFSDFLNITDAAITIIILFMDITYIFFNATFFKDIQRSRRR